MKSTRLVRALAWLLMLSPSVVGRQAAAQEVRIFLFDTLQASSVRGGFVHLVDREGRTVSQHLNNEDGLISIVAPRAGRYQLRFERAGFSAAETSTFDLGDNQIVDRTFDLALNPVAVPALSDDRVCGIADATSSNVYQSWTEVRKAMRAIVWLYGRDLYLHRTFAYRGAMTDSSESSMVGSANRSGIYRPPLTPVSDEDLAERGFIGQSNGEWYFYLPDPAVVISPRFEATHCFTLTADASGRTGISFFPEDDQSPGDVSGTFWLDTDLVQPVSLDFAYGYGAPGEIGDSLGGHLSFSELASGAWIVDGWSVRLPGDFGNDTVATRYVFEGEDVLEIVGFDGSTLHTAPAARLVGMIYDSTLQGPLAGATVRLVDTGVDTRTDANGRFEMGGPFAGTYGVTFSHSHLDSIGFRAPVSLVSLRPGVVTHQEFVVPPTGMIVASTCSEGGDGDAPFVTGAVVDEAGRPVPFADVYVSSPSVPPSLRVFETFDEVQGLVTTNDRGQYTICGAVRGARISLRAAADGRRSNFVTLVFVENGVLRAESLHAMTTRAWRQDLTLLNPENQTAALTGVVTDTTGGPFGGASVRLIGTNLETNTDSVGRFAFDSLPAGWTRLEIRRVGFRSLERDVELHQNGTVHLPPPTLTMQPLPVQLEDIVVEARAPGQRRALADFEERRSSGQGTYLTRDDFMRAGSPIIPSDILRTVRGLRVFKQGLTTVIETSRGATTFAGPCNPSIYMDNMYLGNTGTTDLDAVVSLEHIEAVEVYTGSTVPHRFNRGCGAIVLWTR